MDTLLEILLEGMVEGSAAGVRSRKVPLAARVVLGVFLLVVLGGTGAFFVWVALAADVAYAVRAVALVAGVLLWGRLAQLARALLKNRRKDGAGKKRRLLLALAAVLLCAAAGAAVLCIRLEARNPAAAAAGLARVLRTDAPYMEQQGYECRERMGAL